MIRTVYQYKRAKFRLVEWIKERDNKGKGDKIAHKIIYDLEKEIVQYEKKNKL